MNTKTILIAALLAALGVSAADVPYTPGTNPGSGVEMTFDGSGNIATLVATPTDGGTITLTGGAATFADGATITVNAPGTLAFAEKVTANGALTINRGDDAYLVWSSDTALNEDLVVAPAFRGITMGVGDLEVARVVSTGPESTTAIYGQQGLWTHVQTLTSGFFVCNKVTAAYVFSARLQISDGKVRCRTGIRSPRFGIYPEEEAEWATDNLYNRWVPSGTGRSDHSERGLYAKADDDLATLKGTYMGSTSDLGFRKIILRRTNVPNGLVTVRLAGGASFGGATTIGAGMEAVVVATSANATSISNAISGDGDFRIESASGNATATLACDMSGLRGGKFVIEGQPNSTMTVTANSGIELPHGGEVHVNTNSTLVLNGINGTGSTYWKASLFVHRGGMMKDTKDWQIMRRQQVVFDGGSYAIGSASGSLYMNCLTLSGASITGSTYIRSVNESEPQFFRVIGTEPSAISCTYGVTAYGYSTEANARNNSCAFRIDVADVTGNSDVDCTMNRFIVDDGKPWLGFEKYGVGTLKIGFKSGKKIRLESKLYAGTLLLGDDIMTNAVEFLGGSLAVSAGAANSLGTLKATTNATLTVGAGGRLSFASFTPGAGLAAKSIIIDAPMEGNFVRFGTNANGLADEHRNYFRWKDATDATKLWRVEQDANGYLHPVVKGLVISFY